MFGSAGERTGRREGECVGGGCGRSHGVVVAMVVAMVVVEVGEGFVRGCPPVWPPALPPPDDTLRFLLHLGILGRPQLPYSAAYSNPRADGAPARSSIGLPCSRAVPLPLEMAGLGRCIGLWWTVGGGFKGHCVRADWQS